MNHPILWKNLTQFCKFQLLKITNLNPKGNIFGGPSSLRIMHEEETKGNGNERTVHEGMGSLEEKRKK